MKKPCAEMIITELTLTEAEKTNILYGKDITEENIMPDTRMTPKKILTHFQYNKTMYIIVILIMAVVGDLAYTMTEPLTANINKIDIEFVGPYFSYSDSSDAAEQKLLEIGQAYELARDTEEGKDVNAEEYAVDLQEVNFYHISYDEGDTSNSEENYYAQQKYMVTLAAQEGDIYVLSRNLMRELADQGVLVPLDNYIASGIIDPGDRDLAKVTFPEVDDDGVPTGEEHVYALQASNLRGFISELYFDPTDRYLCMVVFSENRDTAAVVMQGMIDTFTPEETEASAAEEQPEKKDETPKADPFALADQ